MIPADRSRSNHALTGWRQRGLLLDELSKQGKMPEKIATNILSIRLTRLVDHGIVETFPSVMLVARRSG